MLGWWLGGLQNGQHPFRFACRPPVVDELGVVNEPRYVRILAAGDDLVGVHVTGVGDRTVERLPELEEPTIALTGNALLAVPIQHQLVDEAEVMPKVFPDVPVDTEGRVAAQLDADAPAAVGDRPQHRHHVGSTEPECDEVRVVNPGPVDLGFRPTRHSGTLRRVERGRRPSARHTFDQGS
ncbi:hypothetical protein [Micromonospora sp. LOL_021]|uniref:hypothetical protein n=1 Tax=Micromonospora sp. LOL_021 TaxID=3345417 RepID=UPI003A8B31F8